MAFWQGSVFVPLLVSVIVIALVARRFRPVDRGNEINKALSNILQPLPPPDDIVSIRIYPIKSCRGIDVKSARLLRTGLDLDRNWMFVNADDGQFVTIRTNSNMTLIRTAVDTAKDELTISIKGKDYKMVIPAHPTEEWLRENTKIRKTEIWSQETDGWEYADALTRPIADFLGMDVRLVYKGPTPRELRGSGGPELLGRVEATMFADMLPVLVGSLASINELNGRLRAQGEEEITIERFRPNIIVTGHQAWSEDRWKTLRIISEKGRPLRLDVACRCLRCQVPNVDPDTAEKHPRQPWTELMKYRRIDPGLKFKPSFGMLCAPRDEGLVQVGMKLHVAAVTDDHCFVSPMK